MDNNSYGYGGGYGNGFGQGNNSGQKKDAQSVIRDLERLKYKFTNAARENQDMAQTIDNAITLLRSGEAAPKVQTLQTEAATLAVTLVNAKRKDDVVLVIDGSGSMNGAPMTASLDTVTLLKEAARVAKTPAVQAAFFGDLKPKWITEDLMDPIVRKKYEQGLNSGTDLEPATLDMLKLATVNSYAKKGTHFVLVSDGDLFDAEKSKKMLEVLLAQNPKATLDVVVIGRYGTLMEKMTSELAAQFPKQVSLSKTGVSPAANHSVYDPAATSAEVRNVVTKLVTDRLNAPAARKKTQVPKP